MAVMPRWMDSGVPVRVSSTPRWANWASDVHTFWPFARQAPSDLDGPAHQRPRLLPVPGSEKPWHQVSSPAAAAAPSRQARSGRA